MTSVLTKSQSSAKRRIATAYHEAGHAIAALAIGCESAELTLDGSEGRVRVVGEIHYRGVRHWRWGLLARTYSGPMAEARRMRKSFHHCLARSATDRQAASDHVFELAAWHYGGFAWDVESLATKMAAIIVKSCWGYIDIVATELLRDGMVEPERLIELTRGMELPDWEVERNRSWHRS